MLLALGVCDARQWLSSFPLWFFFLLGCEVYLSLPLHTPPLKWLHSTPSDGPSYLPSVPHLGRCQLFNSRRMEADILQLNVCTHLWHSAALFCGRRIAESTDLPTNLNILICDTAPLNCCTSLIASCFSMPLPILGWALKKKRKENLSVKSLCLGHLRWTGSSRLAICTYSFMNCLFILYAWLSDTYWLLIDCSFHTV